MKLIKWGDTKKLKWKNGLGFTNEIIIYPENDIFVENQFGWRVSSAEILESSSFSLFNNYDRTIALIEGEGMILYTKDSKISLLNDNAFSFSGDQMIKATLIKDKVRDINIFTQKTKFNHKLERLEFNDPSTRHKIVKNSKWMILFFLDPIKDNHHRLIEKWDTIILENESELIFSQETAQLTLFKIEIHPVAEN